MEAYQSGGGRHRPASLLNSSPVGTAAWRRPTEQQLQSLAHTGLCGPDVHTHLLYDRITWVQRAIWEADGPLC